MRITELPSNSTGRGGGAWPPARLTRAWCLLVLMLLCCHTGCAGKKKAGDGEIQLAKPEGNINRTTVISGSRRRDTAAYDESADSLTDSDWSALEKLGPRPMWEALEAKRKRAAGMHAARPVDRLGATRRSPPRPSRESHARGGSVSRVRGGRHGPASMVLAGMQSFRAQHSNGYQSCASAGAHPRTILASPAMAANAKGADMLFIDRPAEQSKDERHVDAAERAVC